MGPDEVNRKLVELYGKDLYGNPNYRLVWSSNQTEKRKGTFNDYHGNIFIREVTEVREVPKYPYAEDRWVLERIIPNPFSDEVEGKLSYEPVWIFQDNNGGFLPPVWRAVQLIMGSIMNPEKLTPGQVVSKDEESLKQEIDWFENYLAGDSTWVSNALATREAIVVPNKEFGK